MKTTDIYKGKTHRSTVHLAETLNQGIVRDRKRKVIRRGVWKVERFLVATQLLKPYCCWKMQRHHRINYLIYCGSTYSIVP